MRYLNFYKRNERDPIKEGVWPFGIRVIFVGILAAPCLASLLLGVVHVCRCEKVYSCSALAACCPGMSQTPAWTLWSASGSPCKHRACCLATLKANCAEWYLSGYCGSTRANRIPWVSPSPQCTGAWRLLLPWPAPGCPSIRAYQEATSKQKFHHSCSSAMVEPSRDQVGR